MSDALKELKLSQQELAERAGLSPTTINTYLSGRRGASKETLAKIAQALKLPPAYVFEKAGILPPSPETSITKRKLAHVANQLPDSDVKIALYILEHRLEFYKKHPQARPEK